MESLEGKLGRLTEQIADKGKWSAYKEAIKNCRSLESKIAAAESVLRTIKEVSESRAPLTKHNGAGDNGREVFTESDHGPITETAFARGEAALFKGLGLSESDQRKLKNLPPVGSPTLTPAQLREYRWLRQINLGEADALRGALKVA